LIYPFHYASNDVPFVQPSWEVIGRRCGVTPWMAKRIHDKALEKLGIDLMQIPETRDWILENFNDVEECESEPEV
jgi:hypothetical protein